jgi:exopolysaccharide production protein ExoQ
MSPAENLKAKSRSESWFESIASFDCLVSIAAVSGTILSPAVGTAAAVVFFLAVIAVPLLRLELSIASLRGNGLLLLIPGYCLLSALWSAYPGYTVYYGIQFFFTVIMAIYIASFRSPSRAVLGVALALNLYIFASLLVGSHVALGAAGDQAFGGLASSKNYEGDTAALALLGVCYLIVFSLVNRRPSGLLPAGIFLASDLYSLVAAKSAGAIVIGGLAALSLPFLYVFARLPRLVKSVAILNLVLLATFVAIFSSEISAMALKSFNKDPTLTGRTYIWFKAAYIEAVRPWFGTGFYGFWVQGNPDAEAIWSYAKIQSRAGFNFHNTQTEILVTLGYVGLAIIVASVACLAIRTVLGFVRNPSVENTFWISVLLYEAGRLPLESIGMSPISYTTLMIFGGLAMHSRVWQLEPSVGRLRSPPGELSQSPRLTTPELHV